MRQLKSSPAKQSGLASLVFVLLVTLVITSSTTNVVKTIRNTQEVSTAVNATSHAQAATWVVAEAFRIYLQSLNVLQLQAINQGDIVPVTMDPIFGNLTAQIDTAVQNASGNFDISATIVNRHAASRSSASLKVAYDVNVVTTPRNPMPPTPTVNFNDSLNINGGIELLNNGNPVNLSVDGDVDIGGVSVNPINSIYATGTVEIDSRVTVDSIFAEDDVILRNTIAQTVRTLGNLTAEGSATVFNSQANGDIHIDASGRFEQVSSRQNITVTRGGAGQGVLNAAGDITVTSTGSIDSLSAKGDINFGNWFTIGEAVSEGNIRCTSPHWSPTESITANGSLINCGSTVDKFTAGANNTVTTIAEITPGTLTLPEIDVWTLRDSANYFVEYNSDNNSIEVTVNNVNGLPDGSVYKLARFQQSGAPYIDYLCSTVGSDGKCTSPSTPTAPICFGYSLNNDCITYNTGTNTFRIFPNTTAPGVIFFDGNLEVGNGHSMSTILASGNIKTSGNFRLWAANRGSYEYICAANADQAPSAVRTRYTEAYSTHYPVNLCDIANSDYLPTSVGNIGLAAGGINPDINENPHGLYSGGDIDLGSSTDIVGGVFAGNFLQTNGNVNIQGAVSAGAQGDPNSSNNSLGARTVIDFATVGDFDPLDTPITQTPPPPPPTTTITSVLRGSRPL